MGDHLFQKKWRLLHSQSQVVPSLHIVGTSVSLGLNIHSENRNIYNYSFYGTSTRFLKHISEFLVRSKTPNASNSYALLEFLPQLTTYKSIKTLKQIEKFREANVLDLSQISDRPLIRLDETLSVLSMKMLGGYSSAVNTNVVRRFFFPRKNNPSLSQGELMTMNFQFQNERFDLIENRFDQVELDNYLTVIQNLKSVFGCVIVFVPPHPLALWDRSKEGKVRVKRTLNYLEERSGSKIHIMNDRLNFSISDFRDATHLRNELGMEKLSKELSHLIESQCHNQQGKKVSENEK